MRALLRLLAAVLPLLLAACGGTPSRVTFQVRAGTDINPDGNGEAKPTSLRLYLLTAGTHLRSADYFALIEHEQETLGSELLLRRDLTIRPGETRDIRVTVPEDTKEVAAVAGFQQLDQANWVATRAIPSDGRVPVILQARTVSLPGRLPSARDDAGGFQLPSVPSLPSMPTMPSLPPVPSLPSLPSLPSASAPSLPSLPRF